MFPSTRRWRLFGGFIACGTAGVGSMTYGPASRPRQRHALRVVTMGREPRVLECAATTCRGRIMCTGPTGSSPSWRCRSARRTRGLISLVTFGDFMEAARFSQALGESDGITKKLVTPMAWPVDDDFKRLTRIPAGAHSVITMVGRAVHRGVRRAGARRTGERSRFGGRRRLRTGCRRCTSTRGMTRCSTPSRSTLDHAPAGPLLPGRNLELIEHMYRTSATR